VLKEISRMAFYDPLDLIEIVREAMPDELRGGIELSDDGKVITGLRSAQDIKFLPEDVRRAIVGWGYDRNQNFTLKLADKSKALDQLARHLSLYNDKLEVTGVDALADRLARANKRASEGV
jgi:phage terminase small subunit